ncbi:MAG: DUF5719 family protein, partial [Actinomycetota bacterium]
DLTLMTDQGEKKPAELQNQTIPKNSRRTFPLHAYITTYDVSTMVTSTGGDVICERAMYSGDWSWGHDSIGVTMPASTWYLAEGSTAGGMQTYILVQNPNPDPVTVDLTLMTDQGEKKPAELQNQTIPKNSRRTFPLHAYITTYDVSTMVTSTGGDVICERAMYSGDWSWGHDSIGVTMPASTWYLAEGSTAGGMQTYILVQNPNPDPVTVDLTLMTDQGEKKPAELQNQTIPKNSRRTFPLHAYITTYDVSTKVDATGGPVICERAMYSGDWIWGHDSVGFTP